MTASVSELELDLDVFQGPFDLLLAVLLREEISLAEVALGEIVLAYVDHLEEAGELDLDAVTEFLVLIAALLELKSRLLLPSEHGEDRAGAPRRRPTSCWRGCSSTAATARPRQVLERDLRARGRRTSTARRRRRRSCAARPSRPRSRPMSPTGSGRRSATC